MFNREFNSVYTNYRYNDNSLSYTLYYDYII